ncbi:ead/Ea22-like family protein [Klebsiella variicola]|uniref:ead/Ea22-like family protein n=1 Tax=Klebsiella variicola TaxID=244366 RepID=UPI0035A3D02F
MTDITELAQRMKAAAGKATQGEWWADEVKNEGCYGSGDDCVEGFTSYAIYGSDGQTLFDSLNSDAACICEEYDGEGHVAWDETAQRNAEFIALANPANVLALVEALEKAQQRISELTSENAALKGSVENAAACINAAYFEGLSDVLAESSDDRLVDLVKRRLLFAYLPVEAPATDDALVAMGDAVLLEQLEDSRKAILSQSKIIAELESQLKAAENNDIDARCHIAEMESRTVTAAAADVLAERQRQVSAEGWTAAHDDEYQHCEMAVAAACYIMADDDPRADVPELWPWPSEWWKPTNIRRDLVKAGALILAEIERLDRAAGIKVEAE